MEYLYEHPYECRLVNPTDNGRYMTLVSSSISQYCEVNEYMPIGKAVISLDIGDDGSDVVDEKIKSIIKSEIRLKDKVVDTYDERVVVSKILGNSYSKYQQQYNILQLVDVFSAKAADEINALFCLDRNKILSVFVPANSSVSISLYRILNYRMDKPVSDKALRYTEGKPKWSLVHFQSLEPMIRVLEFGAKKYAPGNWMKPMDKKQILECMQRHLAALMDGEDNDVESTLHHIGHIQCNAMFYAYHDKKDKQNQQPNQTAI